MKKYILIGALILTCSIGFDSSANSQPTLIKGYATAYNGPTDTTCTGAKVRHGICGGCEDYIGKTIVLYQRLPDNEVGEIIGIYECLDTGTGTDAFREGRLIDVWCADLDECQAFMDRVYANGAKGKVWIQIINAEG